MTVGTKFTRPKR